MKRIILLSIIGAFLLTGCGNKTNDALLSSDSADTKDTVTSYSSKADKAASSEVSHSSSKIPSVGSSKDTKSSKSSSSAVSSYKIGDKEDPLQKVCLAPFLADNCSEIVLIDLRYYVFPVSEIVENENIDEVLFLYSLDSIVNTTDPAGVY